MSHEYFTKAVELYNSLIALRQNPATPISYVTTLIDTAEQARLAVLEDRQNGDAYIILATVLSMEADQYPDGNPGNTRYIGRSAAVIYHWKSNKTKLKSDPSFANFGERVYAHISECVNDAFATQGGVRYFESLYKQYFNDALAAPDSK